MQVSNFASASSRAVLPNTTASARAAAGAQQTLSNRLTERLGLEPGALAGNAADYSPAKVAERLLGFIQGHIERAAAGGADPDKLANLLQQARDGVEKGFAEANKILDGLGVLKGQVASGIEDTYARIQNGLDGLSQRFATPSPSAAADAKPRVSSERFVAQAQTFELDITTRDGDRLHVSVLSAQSARTQTSLAPHGEQDSREALATERSGRIQIGAWQVQLDGELDDQEHHALESVFDQVQALSDSFYTGDLTGAFDRAMALDMDGQQLASMSLRLTQTSIRQATDAYSVVARDGGQSPSAVNGDLLDYAQGLLEALRTVDSLTADGKGLLGQLLTGGFALDGRFDQPRLDKAAQLNRLLLQGLADPAAATG